MTLPEIVAIAIARTVPVYRRDGASGRLRPASLAELAEAPDPSSALLIARDDAESAAERLVARYVRSYPSIL